MKKKILAELSTSELIAELKSKANGVVNKNYKPETRSEYREYLGEILDELETRDLSYEEQKAFAEALSGSGSLTGAAEEAVEGAAEEAVEGAAEEAAKKAAQEAAAEEAAKKAAEEEAAKKAAEEEAAKKKAAEEEAAKKAAEEVAKTTANADEDWLDEFIDNLPAKSTNETKKKEISDEEMDSFGTFEEEETTVSKDKKSVWLVILGIAVVLCLIIILVMVFVPKKEYNQEIEDGDVPDLGISGEINNSNVSTFDISNFNATCVNLASARTDEEDIVGNVYKVTENIGAKKLEELTKKYGETTVADTIVNIIVGGSEVMRDAKIAKEGWQYNPNATDDYYKTYMEICETYETKTGKKATVAMDNIEAYKANPGDRAAIEAEIRATGDLDLLTWYQANATASDVLTKQSRDTHLADQYKENVEDKLIESQSFIKILEKVLQKQKNNGDSNAFKDYIAIEIAAVVGAAE